MIFITLSAVLFRQMPLVQRPDLPIETGRNDPNAVLPTGIFLADRTESPFDCDESPKEFFLSPIRKNESAKDFRLCKQLIVKLSYRREVCTQKFSTFAEFFFESKAYEVGFQRSFRA